MIHNNNPNNLTKQTQGNWKPRLKTYNIPGTLRGGFNVPLLNQETKIRIMPL